MDAISNDYYLKESDTLGAAGDSSRTRWGAYSLFQAPLAGGGLARCPSPQTPHRCRHSPFMFDHSGLSADRLRDGRPGHV